MIRRLCSQKNLLKNFVEDCNKILHKNDYTSTPAKRGIITNIKDNPTLYIDEFMEKKFCSTEDGVEKFLEYKCQLAGGSS